MKISESGQVTIPKTLRKRFGLNREVEIELAPTSSGLLIRKRSLRGHPVDAVLGILKKSSNTDEYIEKVRGR